MQLQSPPPRIDPLLPWRHCGPSQTALRGASACLVGSTQLPRPSCRTRDWAGCALRGRARASGEAGGRAVQKRTRMRMMTRCKERGKEGSVSSLATSHAAKLCRRNTATDRSIHTHTTQARIGEPGTLCVQCITEPALACSSLRLASSGARWSASLRQPLSYSIGACHGLGTSCMDSLHA